MPIAATVQAKNQKGEIRNILIDDPQISMFKHSSVSKMENNDDHTIVFLPSISNKPKVT